MILSVLLNSEPTTFTDPKQFIPLLDCRILREQEMEKLSVFIKCRLVEKHFD
jgi:hypothetical protein